MKKFIVFILTFIAVFSVCGCKGENLERSSYDISVTLNGDMTLDGDMNLTYVNKTGETLNELCFSLYPNAFSETATVKPVYKEHELTAYPYGASYGKIDILSVTERGAMADYEVEGVNDGTLKINLKKPAKSGEKVNVYIKFKCVLPLVNHRFGYGNDTVNLTGFYPILCVYENGDFYRSVYYPAGDPFYSECADYKVKLTLPSTYSVASSMSAINTEWSGGETSYIYKRDNVRDVAFILSEKFKIAKKSENGVDISYYYYADDNPEKTLETAVESLTFYSEKFYKYPYKEYVVAEGDFIYGGMEYPCLSLISDALTPSSRDYTVAHETAHQWWHSIVGVNESERGYIDEGLTEFSTAYYIGESKRFKESCPELIEKTKAEYTAMREALIYGGNVTPPVMERNLKDFSSELEYVMLAYNRSQLMVNEVKNYMGEKKFNAFLRALVKSYAFKNINTSEYVSLAEKHKKGAGEIIKEYVSGSKVIK